MAGKRLKGLLDFAHKKVQGAISSGDWTVDATAGNGHDTRFLAETVGPHGRVWAFDVQRRALRSTRERLARHDLADRVSLLERSHEDMREALPTEARGHVQAVMFNLGYLPGSDKRCITRPSSTLLALKEATSLLSEGGVLTVVCYSGHTGGMEETEAVLGWAEGLAQERFRVLSYHFINQKNDPPHLLIVERQTARSG